MGEHRRVSAYRLVATSLGPGLQFAVLSVQQTRAIMYSSSHLVCAVEYPIPLGTAALYEDITVDRVPNSGMMMRI